MHSQTTYGYARVSSRDQNLNRQLDALERFEIDRCNVFVDKASGKDFERPKYKQLMRRLKAGDVLVVKSIDRLGRNYEEILEQWRLITQHKKAQIVVLDVPLLDTRENKDGILGVFIADLMLQLLSYIAQAERENIRLRQAEGIVAAKARGVRFGRPPLERPELYEEAKQAYLADELSRKEAAELLDVSVTTFSKWVRQDTEDNLKSHAPNTP